MRMRSLVRWAGLAVVAAATVSCGDVVTSNDSSLMLSVASIVPFDVNIAVTNCLERPGVGGACGPDERRIDRANRE